MDALARDTLLVGAGLVAGTLGAAGGITTLVSYPALLAVGLSPLSANVTNAVSLSASLVGSSLGSRPELVGQRARFGRWVPIVVAGCLVGVAVLLETPAPLFARVVPYLLLAAAVALVAQPWLMRRRRASHPVALGVALFGVGVYVGVGVSI
ncbi:MAG: TSUP family transporter [Acidimicrobiales bacterium]